MTRLLYREDPYLLEFDAAVVARREHQGRPAVVLDRTAFYPEGGGQPWDTGTLGDAAVVAVLHHEDEVLHILDGPLPGERVHGSVEGERRRDHREQHHGQHLLSQALMHVAGARTVSFHLGPEASSIDLDAHVGEEDLRRAETRANEVVWGSRPVTVRVVSRREAESLGVQVKDEAGDEVRLVEAEGFDLQACGGTHPRNTSEVGVILVLGHERYKGGTRVRFVCGHRALGAFRQRARVLDRLGTLFSSSLEGLAEAAERTVERLDEGERRSRELLDRALEGEARRLLAEAKGVPAVVVSAYEGWAPADLRTLASHLVALAPCVALLGSRTDKAHLVFAQSDGLPHDIPALLRDALSLLGGRGGGKGNIAQGGGDRPQALDEALAKAALAVHSRTAEKR